MPTSTLTRVAHRAALQPGVRATTASTSRHFFLPSTFVPIQRASRSGAPYYYNQQRFATVDTSGSRRGSGNIGKAAETIAADIDSDLDYPTEMDERYSTSSWSEASHSTMGSTASSPKMSSSSHAPSASSSSANFQSRPEKTAAGIGSEPNRPGYDSNAASDAAVGGVGDNTLL